MFSDTNALGHSLASAIGEGSLGVSKRATSMSFLLEEFSAPNIETSSVALKKDRVPAGNPKAFL